MITVDEALHILTLHRPKMLTETVLLQDAVGRCLSEDISATFDQPSFPVSMMDGYACRLADAEKPLTVIGESRAGKCFDGRIGVGQAVRIFTGAVLPEGADFVEIQEHAKRDGDTVLFTELSEYRTNIRSAGSDFKTGQTIFPAGHKIKPATILSLASCNLPTVPVMRSPVVAILRAGDELNVVGSKLERGHIIDSNGPALMALLKSWGIEAMDLGIAKDNPQDIRSRIKNCRTDVIIPIGGASVGDYDFMRQAFAEEGYKSIFEKVSIKPGKPTWFANRGEQYVLGLPGNPVSAWVCAHIFLRPLLGLKTRTRNYTLAVDLPPNGKRETYLRARFTEVGHVEPIETQDSGLVTPLAATELFIRRPINAPSAQKGDNVEGIV